MKAEKTLSTIMGAQMLLNFHGFEAQRDRTADQLLNLAEALISDSGDTEKILNEMAKAQAFLLQLQMHYEEGEVLPLDIRIATVLEVMIGTHEYEIEDTI